ncbi:MAG TPA: TolC family protein [Terriglobales bacterium]|nr:TolC family protein [Terriglobales bacterium]
MQLPCRKKSFLRFSCTLMIVLLLVGGLWAQTDASTSMPQAPSASKTAPTAQPRAFVVGEYANPRSHFPNPIAPYAGRTVAPPNLTNTPRLDQLLQNGKLMLSMNDAIALALENNLDIAISRYNLSIADTDVLRTKAGATLLGVNTGVVQGTPGGGIGGFGGATTASGGAGGTTTGGGGAGAGTLGIVSSTLGLGSPISSYDPILTGTLQLDRFRQQASSAFIGVPFLDQNTSTADFTYNQGFATGTNLSVGFNNTRVTTNSPFTTLSPTLNSNFKATVTQHLLQGFGFVPNKRFIVIAQNNRELTDVAFRLQITTTVDQIQNMYWDLVNAYENVKVQQDALALADKTLSDNKKQVQIGTLAPIEVVRAQSQVATSQQSLIVAKTNLELQQLLMKNALSRSVQDPALIDAEVIPTDTMRPVPSEPLASGQDLVGDALSHRPELQESRIDLKSREVSMKAVRNALLPSVDLFAYYGGSGLGGAQNPTNLCANQAEPTFGCAGPPGQVPIAPTTSYGATLNQLINSTAPDKGAGISLIIPIRNRTAQANHIRSQLEYRQAQLRLQQVENEIRIEVRNAEFALQQNRASVAAAQAAVDLAQESLDAEQKKYALGASTSTLVLQQSSALTQGRSNLVAARAAYEKARVELDRATGLLLEHNGIDINDAQSGVVTKLPNVPYVIPRSEVKPEPVPQLPTQPLPGDTNPAPAPPQN